MSLKDKILEESLKLFLEKGIQGTSIKAIAEASGTSNGGLYHHFANKEEIAFQVYTDLKQDLLQDITHVLESDITTRELLFLCWKHRIKVGIDNPKRLIFLKSVESKFKITEFVKKNPYSGFEKLMNEFQKRMERGDLAIQDMDFFSFHFLGSTDAVINYLTLHKEKISDEFITDKYKYYWRSIVNI